MHRQVGYGAVIDRRPRQPIGNFSPGMIVWEIPSADLTGLQSIMDCDLVVLVARCTPRAALRELLDSLTDFGVAPTAWCLRAPETAPGVTTPAAP